ncbi:MAG TPA: DEAD/DEAH box helicase family protein [Streptosporangiaceae bacterium]|nr:DEAD/DEAH box helicase family protein [Streptosporangiaceae bacterium]
MSSGDSPFMEVPASQWIAANRSAFVIADRFPVSPGHALVVPRRVIATWWEATDEERSDMLALVDEVKDQLDAELAPDGYNVGFNAGEAAGQTFDHLHIHVIPRYRGDMSDPRGGVRRVIPSKENYLRRTTEPYALVDGPGRLLRDDLLKCLRDPRLDRVDLLVSFVMKSGLEQLRGGLVDALDRGARIRVLTTDYLTVTDADALARLLDLAEVRGQAIATRVFHDPATSFHPKAYLFYSVDGTASAAFVGSNNLSASGIGGGIEWAIGADQSTPFLAAFERLWSDPRSQPLTHELLAEYRRCWQPTVHAAGVIPEPPATAPTPWPVQQEALAALEQTRLQGFHRGLVVMATGLGKTWLAAFDAARPQFRRVLFVAHREEILRQSLEVFRRVQPDADLGLYYGGEKRPEARVLFAGVQTLAGNLHRFAPDRFDYIVVDEFHHAAARGYRRVIDHFQPGFLLGLTATPNRMDGADLLALCSDNLIYECPLTDGVERGDLSPFRYFGIADDVDYAPIPWRRGQFDPAALTEAVETQERAQHAFDVWRDKGGGRSIAFCVTVTHADFTAEFFRRNGVAAVAVHSGPTSAPRVGSVERLRAGELQIICTVDVFNEGLDVPEVDTVLMLRPTESPVVFLQQLGRGLRRNHGKDALTVIDFIGNHRSFLIKPRTLLALGTGRQVGTDKVLRAIRTGDFGLPAGCSATYDVELVDILRTVMRVGARSALEDYCRSYADERGYRPSALQAYEAGYNPSSVRARHAHWFAFLDDVHLLSQQERKVMQRHAEVLAGIEKEQVTKSYKLVTLQALLQMDALRTGADVAEIAWTAHRLVTGDPRLLDDTSSTEMPDPASVDALTWREYWLSWPLSAWAGRLRGASAGWFRIDGRRFVPAFQIATDVGETFDAMVEEVVDYRLARYLFTKSSRLEEAIRLKVIQAHGRPILMLDRDRNRQLPEGETLFVADGVSYSGNFAKIALNVARRIGHPENALADLLWSWFGTDAGQPGTLQYVELVPGKPHWKMQPASPVAVGDESAS